jgi:hypothetical protein
MSNWRRRLPEAVVITGILILILIILALYGYLTGAWEVPATGE